MVAAIFIYRTMPTCNNACNTNKATLFSDLRFCENVMLTLTLN